MGKTGKNNKITKKQGKHNKNNTSLKKKSLKLAVDEYKRKHGDDHTEENLNYFQQSTYDVGTDLMDKIMKYHHGPDKVPGEPKKKKKDTESISQRKILRSSKKNI